MNGLQFLEVGRFLISIDEIVAIYTDNTDIHIALKHPVQQGHDGVPKYIIWFDKTSPEAEQLLKWARLRIGIITDQG